MSALENRTVMSVAAATAPSMMWAMSLVIPGRNASTVRTETANKSRIMQLVNGIANYVGKDNSTPLGAIVDKCYALGDFPALWAIEGVGKDLAEWHMARDAFPKDMLRAEMLEPRQAGAWLMLHAGIGMGFARVPIQSLPAGASDAQVGDVAMRAVDLCRANSMQGYAGAAIESIGLVSRFMREPAFCRQIHKALDKRDPDAATYYWRGVGRCLYFHPANFAPGFSRPYRALPMIEAEAPSADLKNGMVAGFSWALTVVNMSTPEVMEWVLGNVDELTSQPAFTNGITSSVVMRHDTTPNFQLPRDFMNHRPADPKIAKRWEEKVGASIAFALGQAHPALAKAGRLEEVFHYQTLPELVARLSVNVH